MQIDESLIEAAARDAVERARKYPLQPGDLGDCTRGVDLKDEERAEARAVQNCVTLSEDELFRDARRVLIRVFEEIPANPAQGRKPIFLNIAGPYGLNEILKTKLAEGDTSIVAGAREFYDKTKGSNHTFGLGDFFRKLQPYNPQDHNHTFPLVRGQASGIMEAAKELAAKVGLDIIANDAFDFGKDGKDVLKPYHDKFGKTHDFAVIAYALDPEKAWEVVKTNGDSRFNEEGVKASAVRFAQSFVSISQELDNVILLNEEGRIIFHKENGQPKVASEEYLEWRARNGVGVQPGGKGGFGRGDESKPTKPEGSD